MATTRKTITVPDQQDQWIKTQIAAGDFTNNSEYARDPQVSHYLLLSRFKN